MTHRPHPTSWCSNSRINTFNHSSTVCNRSLHLKIRLSVQWALACTQFSSSSSNISNTISCCPHLPHLRSWDPHLSMHPKLPLSSLEVTPHYTTVLLMDSRKVKCGCLSRRIQMFSNLLLLLLLVINSSSDIKEGSSMKIPLLSPQMQKSFGNILMIIIWEIKLLKFRLCSKIRQQAPVLALMSSNSWLLTCRDASGTHSTSHRKS